MLVLSVVVAVSSLYWLVQAAFALRTRLAIQTVASLPEPSRTAWPIVSILIPARDEGAHVKEALKAKLADGYPALELVLVDDRSTDDTGAQARSLNDPRLTVTRVDTLPEGWLGKVNALQKGLEASKGEWLLFSDADVHLAPGTLSRIIAWAEAEGVDHVSALPKIVPGGVGISLALSAFFRLIVSFSRLWAVADPKSGAAMGVGAFNLVRRSALERTPGLEWLKMEIGDDAALGFMLKRSGAKARVLVAQETVSLEFYPSVRAMFRALEKNGALAPAGLIWLGLAVLLTLELGWLAAFASADLRVQLGGVLCAALGVMIQLIIGGWLRLPAWTALFPGVGTVPLAGAIARSAWLAWRRGGVMWRGTFYATDVVRAGQRIGK